MDTNGRMTFTGQARLAIAAMVLLLVAMAGQVRAHTLDAAFAVFEIDSDATTMAFKLQTNVEAMIAEIEPWLEDTSESPNAAEYDRLRALPPEELLPELERTLERLIEGIDLQFDGQRVPVQVTGQTIPDVGDLFEPRVSEITLNAQIPPGAEAFTFAWAPELGDVIIRTVGERSRTTHFERIDAGATSSVIALDDVKKRTGWQMAWDFVVIGFDHIIPKGLDHILFVVGIFLLSTQLRPILWQVTTFTLAHTVTLGLGAAGLVNIPPSIVEPLIAASIVYVAVENIFTDKLSPWRPALVFGFGLLHGLGFAGILREFNVPPGDFVMGLLSFNIGVELGQLAVIAACFLLVGIWFGNKPWYRRVIVIPGSVAIAGVATYWFFERVFG